MEQQKIIEKAAFLIELRRFEEAEKIIKKLITQLPNSATPYMLICDLYSESRQPDKVIEFGYHGLKIEPTNISLHLSMAYAFFNKHRFQKVYQHAELVLTRDPECIPALNIQALSLLYEGNKSQSLSIAKKTMKLSPDHIDTLSVLGQIYYQMDDYVQSEKFYRKLLQIQPAKPNGHYYIALTLQRQEKFEQAIEHLVQAIKISPNENQYRQQLVNVVNYLIKYRMVSDIKEYINRVNPEAYRILNVQRPDLFKKNYFSTLQIIDPLSSYFSPSFYKAPLKRHPFNLIKPRLLFHILLVVLLAGFYFFTFLYMFREPAKLLPPEPDTVKYNHPFDENLMMIRLEFALIKSSIVESRVKYCGIPPISINKITDPVKLNRFAKANEDQALCNYFSQMEEMLIPRFDNILLTRQISRKAHMFEVVLPNDLMLMNPKNNAIRIGLFETQQECEKYRKPLDHLSVTVDECLPWFDIQSIYFSSPSLRDTFWHRNTEKLERRDPQE